MLFVRFLLLTCFVLFAEIEIMLIMRASCPSPPCPCKPRATFTAFTAKAPMSAPALPLWSDEELAVDLQTAVGAFVARRLAEPAAAYPRHLKAAQSAQADLLRALATLGDDPTAPRLTELRRLLFDPRLFTALRYLTAPPVSEDDLYTLTAARPGRLTRAELGRDDKQARRLFHLILAMADLGRFPWLPHGRLEDDGGFRLLRPGRRPRRGELRRALSATAPLQAAQSLATERRGFGREVEGWLRQALEDAGFAQAPPPNGGHIDNATHAPPPRRFYGECLFFGRRADMLIGLPGAFIVAVESKDSNSAANSVKRLANDTGAKARTWRDGYGANMATVALINGVFALKTLRQVQDAGVRLVWAHRIPEFVAWLSSRAGPADCAPPAPAAMAAEDDSRQLALF
jgi:hypothetical protein